MVIHVDNTYEKTAFKITRVSWGGWLVTSNGEYHDQWFSTQWGAIDWCQHTIK